MNILFISPYRSNTGWGEAARSYTHALIATGHNICLRPIFMDNTNVKYISPKLQLLEQSSCDNFDVIIMNVLPHLLEFGNDNAKHIALSVFETSNLKYTKWPRYLNHVHEVWVPSNKECNDLSKETTTPVKVIPEAVDINIYNKTYSSNITNKKLSDAFTFYFIGEYIPRKNLQALITAFHREFMYGEKVDLVIKTNKGGISPQDLNTKLDQDLCVIKDDLRLYANIESYRKEWTITQYIEQNDLYALHQACDCFVMPSRGEACCRPMLDALGFGNPVIVTDNTGMTSYINDDVGWKVKSHPTPVCSHEHPLPFLYTGHELWSEIDILDLQRCMREAYERNALQKAQTKQKCKEHIKQFSYENIGKVINEVLC